jgi:hypothetical protein
MVPKTHRWTSVSGFRMTAIRVHEERTARRWQNVRRLARNLLALIAPRSMVSVAAAAVALSVIPCTFV